MPKNDPLSNQSPATSFRIKDYIGVFIVSFAAFVFNTSEFIPIGLLSAIAQDFAMPLAGAGFLITMYAWVVALASLPLMLVFSRTELKKLMLYVIGLFVFFHLISALSHSYSLLMASRIGVACSHALFWSIATIMAVRSAPEGKKAIAISFVATGTAVAMIVGLPLGRVIGLYLNWRVSFLCIGLCALLCLFLFWRFFKPMPSVDTFSFKTLPMILQNTNLRGVYLITALIITANFTAYSYIEPFLAQIAKMNDTLITLLLIGFGAIGFVSSVIFSKFYEKMPQIFVYTCIFSLCFVFFVLHLASFHGTLIILLCLFWGFMITIFNLSFQSQIITLAPKATAIAMSIFSGIYNVGIGSGALIGGFVEQDFGIEYIGYVGGAIGVVACVYALKKVSFRWIKVNVKLAHKKYKKGSK